MVAHVLKPGVRDATNLAWIWYLSPNLWDLDLDLDLVSEFGV